MSTHWTCPYCDRDTLVRSDDITGGECYLKQANKDGYRVLHTRFIVCPNPKCQRFTLEVYLFESAAEAGKRLGEWKAVQHLRTWRLAPESKAKTYPSYIPKAILDDYSEACLIADLSPKASATLSRRCLQGIIRDFWKVKSGRLVDEIAQIKDKTDPATWEAIEAVRHVGNIGAHMEKDINVIVDVDPKEATLLIDLIEMLLKDWYIAREKRKEQLQKIKDVATAKDAAKKGLPPAGAPASTP